MSEDARKLLKDILNGDLLQMVFSSCRDPKEPPVVKVRPVMLRGELMFQASWREQNKEKHRNMTAPEAEEQSMAWLVGPYHQMQAECTDRTAGVLVSKKGKMTVRSRVRKDTLPARELSHNRKKQYILEEGRPVTFLTELGVMTPEGRVVHKYSDKFRQINRFLEFIEDVVPSLPKDREVRIIDFGCGKSYLTFAVYYYPSKIIQENHADHAKDVKVSTTFNKITYKYLMLPIWCSSFKYQDKVYQFMVNGQTGKVYGKTPISVGKVILVIAIIVAIIAIFACCFGGFSTIQDIINNLGN